MDHDLRQWYRYVCIINEPRTDLNIVSACVVGSSIICVDLIIQRIPGKRNFRIQHSNAFLSSSLSLSFGVMVSPDLIVNIRSSAD